MKYGYLGVLNILDSSLQHYYVDPLPNFDVHTLYFLYSDGAMQPSKRGNFFHIDSVQPMTEGTYTTFDYIRPIIESYSSLLAFDIADCKRLLKN